VKNCKPACRSDLEHDSAARATSVKGGPVEIPVGALNQAGVRVFPVGGVKAEKQCKLAGRRNPENNTGIGTGPVRGRSIEIAVPAQSQRSIRRIAVGVVELVKKSERA